LHIEAVAKLHSTEKSMILSQFASRLSGRGPIPSTYFKRVGLGDGVAKWLKRAILLWCGVLQLPRYSVLYERTVGSNVNENG